MDRRDIQRLAAIDVDAEQFRRLKDHGEEILVERKRKLPEPEKLGDVVASMANLLGGFVLLGVDDKTRKLEPLELPQGVDLQSHVGNLLRKTVNPVPPYIAEEREIDGARVGFIRVFPASVPVITVGGAVNSRDAGGIRPVSDHRELLELARRGADAEDEARERPGEPPFLNSALALPFKDHGTPEFHLRTIVRAAPLTVTPQFRDWPISRGPKACFNLAHDLATHVRGEDQGEAGEFHQSVQPNGRGVAAFADRITPRPFLTDRVVVAADCAGVVAAGMWREVPNRLPTHDFRRKHIRPAIDVVAELLSQAEAYGDAVLDLLLYHQRDEVTFPDETGATHELPEVVHCGSAILTTPASEDDCAELAKFWEREVARNAGLALWEEPQASD